MNFAQILERINLLIIEEQDSTTLQTAADRFRDLADVAEVKARQGSWVGPLFRSHTIPPAADTIERLARRRDQASVC